MSRRQPLWWGALLGVVLFALSRGFAFESPPLGVDPMVARALALGLDQGDVIVERRLLRDMAFLGFTGSQTALLAEAPRAAGAGHRALAEGVCPSAGTAIAVVSRS